MSQVNKSNQLNQPFICGRFEWSWDAPKVMGIVNVTPDSFSDGGRYDSVSAALAYAEALIGDGADILDIGGESTRPNAPFVSEEEEWARVESVLLAVHKLNVPISLDTRRSYVMQRALDTGLVDLINDVSALEDDGALEIAASSNRVGVCLMHKQGDPHNMQHNPHYENVVEDVVDYLKQRVLACEEVGIARNRLMIDPGFGFGKTLAHNVELLNELANWLPTLNLPVLIGLSRKKMLGEITGEAIPSLRRGASVAAALACVARGANVVRVHDVKDTVQAIKVWQEVGVFL